MKKKMCRRIGETYPYLKAFKRKYPSTVAWRIKRHARIIDIHLNENEKILYAFVAQKNEGMFDFVNTYAIVLTNKRLMLGTKRLLCGYFFTAITPDMFNDLTVKGHLLWGDIEIDTVKEFITLSNISKKALPEIGKKVTDLMMKEKRKYQINRCAK